MTPKQNGLKRLSAYAACCVVATSVAVGQQIAPRLELSLDSSLHAFVASDDGRWLAAAGTEAFAVWDRATGGEMFRIETPQHAAFSISFSPDGERLAVGRQNGVVQQFNPIGEQINGWRAGDGAVLACAFSPDGAEIATGGGDQIVRLWNAETGERLLAMRGHSGAVFALAYHPNLRRLASGGADGRVILWNANTGDIETQWERHTDTAQALAFHPDGERLVSGGWDGRIFLLNMRTQDAEALAHLPNLVFSAAVSADGDTLAAGLSQTNGSATLQFWHLPSKMAALASGGRAHRAVQFPRGGGSFVAAAENGEARLWDLEAVAPTPTVPSDANARILRWTATPALYYEVQASRSQPFRPDDTVIVTSNVALDMSDRFADGSNVWWRVRARGFSDATEWSEVRSVQIGGLEHGAARVWLSVQPENPVIGDETTVRVHISDASDLAGFECGLVMEPPLLDVLELDNQGEALAIDGVPIFWAEPSLASSADALRLVGVIGARLDETGVNAAGALFTVRLRAREAGDVSVRLENVKLSDSRQRAIEAEVVNAEFTILPSARRADVNRDGVLNIFDLVFIAQYFGQPVSDDDGRRADVNEDGIVDLFDLLPVAREIAASISAAVAPSPSGRVRLTAEQIGRLRRLQEWVDAANPTSLSAADGRLLRQMLSAAIPTEVLRIGRTYPNPANPETWIPFRLSREARVRVTIYDTIGRVVRTIDIGARGPGDYADRNGAVRWDGRTRTGAVAASGRYVARIEATTADGVTRAATRRIVLSR